MLQIIETVLVLYVCMVGAVALTMYIIGVCVRFVREGRKKPPRG